jgi:hypothetical protein
MKRKLVDNLFPPAPEWALEEDHEPQTFADFKTMERWKLYLREMNESILIFRSKSRKTIYLLPLGDYSEDSPIVREYVAFLSVYFQMPVSILI